jgi:dienelactone hydrolase
MRRWTSLIVFFTIITGLFRLAAQHNAASSFEPLRLQTSPTPSGEKVFDIPALLATPLNPRTLKTTIEDGIVTEEVMFHSENDGAKSVDIFAYFSYPAGARDLPAFIWNQGGMKQAAAARTQFGARRGYATLCIDFPLPGYRSSGDYPIQLGPQLGKDPRQAPIYHGAVALLKAVSYLESRPEVDKERIGMAGSSWGGFFTTLMVGLDARLKAGACMFGSGNLQMGNMWWDAYGRSDHFPSGVRDYWRLTLDPARRLTRSTTPIAWFTGTNDWFYWMPAVMKTYEMTRAPRHLTLVPDWDHALPPAIVEETFAWLDVYLKGAPGLLRVSPLKVAAHGAQREAQWSFAGPRTAQKADLILSYGDAGNWHTRYWKTLPATIEGRFCRAALPQSTLPFYISGAIIDKDGFRTSTPLLRVAPQTQKIAGPPAPLDYDGAAQWGGFEKAQDLYLERHNARLSLTRRVADEGEYSARLPEGRTDLPIVRYTAGVPHRFTCYVKAAQPTPITLDLQPEFNGRSEETLQEWKVGPQWTKISVVLTPEEALNARSHIAFEVPDGTPVWLDDVSFRPLE